MKNIKQLPKFKNEAEEQKFWSDHDSADYVDWSKAEETIFSSLKPTTESISLRLPSSLLANLKSLANSKDIPYQSLMKMYISEKVKRELSQAK